MWKPAISVALLGLLTVLLPPPAVAQWDITCDPAAVPEDEPDCGDPTDTVDGGCSTDPPLFLPMSCGDIVCGTSGYGDYDTYELQAEESMIATWTVIAEFSVTIAVVDGTAGCAESETLALTGAYPEAPASASVPLTAGHTYWFYVWPYGYFACGREYQAELTCEPIVLGACCLADGTCGDLPQVTCDQEDGTYFGDGSACAASVCPNGPGACCAADGACTDAVAQVDCEGLDGIYYGGGSLCAGADCCFYPDRPFHLERRVSGAVEPICYDGYVDDFNGGCDPPQDEFIAGWIECNDLVVGHSGTYLWPDGFPGRDMDLYQTEELYYTTRVIYRVTPTFPAEVGFGFLNLNWLFEPHCDWDYETTATASPCRPALIDVGVTHWTDSFWVVYVRPQAGVEVFQGAPYLIEFTCDETADPLCGYQRRGDANCDNAVNVFDIDAFVLALVEGEAAWTAAYSVELPFPAIAPCGYLCVNDCNGDGAVNVFDIDPFVELLIGAG
jgi:hypothetical protein